MSGLEQNVAVAVRVRPLSDAERAAGGTSVVEVSHKPVPAVRGHQLHQAVGLTPSSAHGDGEGTHAAGSAMTCVVRDRESGINKEFVFDFCFAPTSHVDGPKSFASESGVEQAQNDQEYVYLAVGRRMLQLAFQGINTCIFAYGQTNAGKTYTMMGAALTASEDNYEDVSSASDGERTLSARSDLVTSGEGIVPRTCKELFERVQHDAVSTSWSVVMSYLEVYNEKVYDLLAEGSAASTTGLKVREHPTMGPQVVGLKSVAIRSYDDVERLLDYGNQQRAVSATSFNHRSSRSHAVMTITCVQGKNQPAGRTEAEAPLGEDEPEEVYVELLSKLTFVDLAGSERWDTGATSAAIKEHNSINKSLFCLGRVILSLSEVSDGGGSSAGASSAPGTPLTGSTSGEQGKYVGYRDSVLTWLLKESLGGNSRTLMLANVSPASTMVDETISTLNYAERVKRIRTHARVNDDGSRTLVSDLRREIAKLKQQLEDRVEEHGPAIVGGEQQPSTQEHENDTDALIEEMNKKWEERVRHQHLLYQRKLEYAALTIRQAGAYLINLCPHPAVGDQLAYRLLPGQTFLFSDDDDRSYAGTDIRIREKGATNVSAPHCEITCEFSATDGRGTSPYERSGTPSLRDSVVTSASGTPIVSITPFEASISYVNGKLLTSTTELKDGDRIIVGASHAFRVALPGFDEDPQQVKPSTTRLSSELLPKRRSSGWPRDSPTSPVGRSPTTPSDSKPPMKWPRVLDWEFASSEFYASMKSYHTQEEFVAQCNQTAEAQRLLEERTAGACLIWTNWQEASKGVTPPQLVWPLTSFCGSDITVGSSPGADICCPAVAGCRGTFKSFADDTSEMSLNSLGQRALVVEESDGSVRTVPLTHGAVFSIGYAKFMLSLPECHSTVAPADEFVVQEYVAELESEAREGALFFGREESVDFRQALHDLQFTVRYLYEGAMELMIDAAASTAAVSPISAATASSLAKKGSKGGLKKTAASSPQRLSGRAAREAAKEEKTRQIRENMEETIQFLCSDAILSSPQVTSASVTRLLLYLNNVLKTAGQSGLAGHDFSDYLAKCSPGAGFQGKSNAPEVAEMSCQTDVASEIGSEPVSPTNPAAMDIPSAVDFGAEPSIALSFNLNSESFCQSLRKLGRKESEIQDLMDIQRRVQELEARNEALSEMVNSYQNTNEQLKSSARQSERRLSNTAEDLKNKEHQHQLKAQQLQAESRRLEAMNSELEAQLGLTKDRAQEYYRQAAERQMTILKIEKEFSVQESQLNGLKESLVDARVEQRGLEQELEIHKKRAADRDEFETQLSSTMELLKEVKATLRKRDRQLHDAELEKDSVAQQLYLCEAQIRSLRRAQSYVAVGTQTTPVAIGTEADSTAARRERELPPTAPSAAGAPNKKSPEDAVSQGVMELLGVLLANPCKSHVLRYHTYLQAARLSGVVGWKEAVSHLKTAIVTYCDVEQPTEAEQLSLYNALLRVCAAYNACFALRHVPGSPKASQVKYWPLELAELQHNLSLMHELAEEIKDLTVAAHTVDFSQQTTADIPSRRASPKRITPTLTPRATSRTTTKRSDSVASSTTRVPPLFPSGSGSPLPKFSRQETPPAGRRYTSPQTRGTRNRSPVMMKRGDLSPSNRPPSPGLALNRSPRVGGSSPASTAGSGYHGGTPGRNVSPGGSSRYASPTVASSRSSVPDVPLSVRQLRMGSGSTSPTPQSGRTTPQLMHPAHRTGPRTALAAELIGRPPFR